MQIIRRTGVFYFLTVVAILFVYGCNKKLQESVLENKPIADFQVELLNIAFETATKIPIEPHIKDRSRTQEDVVDVGLKLDQPQLVSGYIEEIDNWRRGLCFAKLALYCAKNGFESKAEEYLIFAEQIAQEDHGQKWRNNRIKTKIAETKNKLGQSKQAQSIKDELAESKKDIVAQACSKINKEDGFTDRIEVLEGLAKTDDIEIIKFALLSMVELYEQFYSDQQRRELTEEKIKASWKKVPALVRLDVLIDLSHAVLKNEDKNKALEFVNEAHGILTSGNWPLDYRVEYTSKLIELRFNSGETDKAKSYADALLSDFNAKKGSILDIYRARSLRPLAQAYQAIGETQPALSVYKQAVEEGTQNPNSRPCAQDLSATCCSMALYAVEPDSELWNRLKEIKLTLGPPW